jgi:hypothetical protein
MISRREFVLSTLAMSAASMSARVSADSPTSEQGGRATLNLYFVGGTVFRRTREGLTAVQPSGKTLAGGSLSYRGASYHMPHRSYIVLRAGTIPNAVSFPRNYPSETLHTDLKSPGDWQPICLVKKDITITQTNSTPFSYRCNRVASAKHLSPEEWRPIGNWQDHTKPLESPVNSRFRVTAGTLDDADAQDVHARGRYWTVGGGRWTQLSDVSVLTIVADEIAMTGLHTNAISIPAGSAFNAYVFSGPEPHRDVCPPDEKCPYYSIEHALLLRTLYDIPEKIDVRPRTDRGVTRLRKGDVLHPCDINGGPLAAQPYTRKSPPDSEYCTNYDELP